MARLKDADSYTYLHAVAVSALMVMLGREIGLTDAQLREAALGGLLHDMGKAAMPLDVLNKPGRLTDEEFDPRLNGPEYAPSNAGQRREDRKIAQIGIRVAKGVTMHGFSFNVCPDMKWFDRIIPCGIRDAGVASLASELGRDVTVEEVVPVAEKHLREVLEHADLRPRPIEKASA